MLVKIWSHWNIHTWLVECNTIQLLWRKIRQFLLKQDICLLYNPTSPLIKRNENKYIPKKASTRRFIAGWNWKNRHPSVRQWINKLRYLHTMGCYSAIKKKELLKKSNNVDESANKISWKKKVFHERVCIYMKEYVFTWSSREVKTHLWQEKREQYFPVECWKTGKW